MVKAFQIVTFDCIGISFHYRTCFSKRIINFTLIIQFSSVLDPNNNQEFYITHFTV
ncbi:hypothetical protein CWI39_0043p0010 [Hamiltosporidium magnivora]|uniref:Uncharacterized protein n=1 Tax=Hamiltosporidium magnivora TaxID=148818 RepID=A0A4Q9LNM0_9MICR|nr:hypothetical protein CWI39_0043p0010 [Hamiltosporidium magnivora]